MEAITTILRTQLKLLEDTQNITFDFLVVWYCYLKRCRGRVSEVNIRRVLKKDQLNVQQQIVYAHVQSLDLGKLESYIHAFPYSGRTIHFFIVKYAAHHPVLTQDGDDLFNEYTRMIKKRGKQFFDCFARGLLVSMPPKNTVSLCRSLFYQWAMEVSLHNIMRDYWARFLKFKDPGKHTNADQPPTASGFSFSFFPTRDENVVQFKSLANNLTITRVAVPRLRGSCVD